MNKLGRFGLTVLVAGILLWWLLIFQKSNGNIGDMNNIRGEYNFDQNKEGLEVATLAGGCFWCIEAPFHNMEGVIEVVSGYAGGTEETATYVLVASGETAHREAVQVFFDPKKVGYSEILDLFWRQIDPTDDGGQFADRGSQYRTAIFTHSAEQAKLANFSKKNLQDSGKFKEVIVTEIVPYTTFFLAEDYHQDYFKKAKSHYEQYKKASGRSGFIEENWAKNAALEYSDKE